MVRRRTSGHAVRDAHEGVRERCPVKDALRLAFGTLTILPVRPPSTVDRRTAGRAMVLAPLVGLSLGLVVVAALWVLGGGSLLTYPPHGSLTYLAGAHDAAPRISPWSPMVAAVAVVALLAFLTRAMHFDGLADVADGLGSGKRGDDALAIMRRSDLGPFGVVTLVLALFFQVMACVELVQTLSGLAGIVVALVLSRLVLPVLCLSGIPAARPDGLGAAVAGSVSRRALALAVGLGVLCVLLVIVLTVARRAGRPRRSRRPHSGLEASTTRCVTSWQWSSRRSS